MLTAPPASQLFISTTIYTLSLVTLTLSRIYIIYVEYTAVQ